MLAPLPLLLAVSPLAADDQARDKANPATTLRDDTVRNWQYELDDFEQPPTPVAAPGAKLPTVTTSGAATLDDAAAPATAAMIAPKVE